MSLWFSRWPTCHARPYLFWIMAWAWVGVACEQQPVPPTTDTINQPIGASPQAPNGTTQVNPNTAASSTQPTPDPVPASPTTPATEGNDTLPSNGNNTVPTNANAPLPNGNDVAITPTAAVVSPIIGFDGAPVNDKKAIALTFDDGPDGAQGATDLVLDTLKKENLKASFFICANVGFADLETDPIAQRQLKRIVAEGHPIGNHTYAHKDLATLASDAEVEAAFSKLDAIYKKVLGPTAPVITTVRAPYGSPFQLDPTNAKRLGPVVTKYGVHIGWGMDTKDWSFDHFDSNPQAFNADVQAVIDAVQKLINNKQWGIVLLHAVHLPTAKALPTIIKMFRDAGYHFVSVEDVVRSQFGANSASIMAANKAAGLTAKAVP